MPCCSGDRHQKVVPGFVVLSLKGINSRRSFVLCQLTTVGWGVSDSGCVGLYQNRMTKDRNRRARVFRFTPSTLSKIQWKVTGSLENSLESHWNSVKFHPKAVKIYWKRVKLHWITSATALKFPVAPGSLELAKSVRSESTFHSIMCSRKNQFQKHSPISSLEVLQSLRLYLSLLCLLSFKALKPTGSIARSEKQSDEAVS